MATLRKARPEFQLPDDVPALLSAAQLGKLIGVHDKTLRVWRARGLKAIKIGKGRSGRVRYAKSDVEEFLSARRR